jgi:hypothetical protein
MYIHTDVFAAQSSKKKGDPCGDAWDVYRDNQATTLILADGIGSGIKAHIAATMCVARLKALLEQGSSLREAFRALTQTMDKAWGTKDPFAVFCLARILNNGQATILSYEMPPPLLVNHRMAQVLEGRIYMQNKAMIHESNCTVSKGEGLVLMSDGITQAGIGKHFPLGWESEGVKRFIQADLPVDRLDGESLVTDIHAQARVYWPAGNGDDCTVLAAINRRGIIVNWLSGPPANNADDKTCVQNFIKSEGIHVVSGGTTAKIVARETQTLVSVKNDINPITPPSYEIAGIELVTEGLVTLNQVFHLLDEDPEDYPENSPVSALAWQLKMADRVNIWEGKAANPGEGLIAFRQQGLLPRDKVLEAIRKKLLEMGKLVVSQSY